MFFKKLKFLKYVNSDPLFLTPYIPHIDKLAFFELKTNCIHLLSPESGALHFRDQLEGKELRVKPDDIKVETMKVKIDKETGKKNITSVDKFVERITVTRQHEIVVFSHCTMIIDMIHITFTVSKIQFF